MKSIDNLAFMANTKKSIEIKSNLWNTKQTKQCKPKENNFSRSKTVVGKIFIKECHNSGSGFN